MDGLSIQTSSVNPEAVRSVMFRPKRDKTRLFWKDGRLVMSLVDGVLVPFDGDDFFLRRKIFWKGGRIGL